MSVIIEFTQIKKQNIISENKIFGLYEVRLDQVEWKDGCFLKVDVFQFLLDDANNWGEVYLKPSINKFLFYLLAVDTESGIGIRTEGDRDIISAFAPNTILEFVETAIKYTQFGSEGGFDKLSVLLKEAIGNDLLIVTRIT